MIGMSACDGPIPAAQAVSIGCGSDELQAVVSPPRLDERAGALDQKKPPFAYMNQGDICCLQKNQ